MAPLLAPAEKPSHRVSDSQSHAKLRPPAQVAVSCAAPWPNLQPSLTPSGVGKTHIALALGLAACQRGLSVRFTTASHLVHEMIEARDEKRLLRLQDQLARVSLLIVDELGYVPLSQTGSELLFDIFSRRYENGATIVTSNLPFQEWTSVFASERLTGALLDRLTHHVHILEMNGESYRLKQSRSRRRPPSE